jgi:hypothetical protein
MRRDKITGGSQFFMMAEKDYRIAGHESFPCRYTWLPKAVRGLHNNPRLFSKEEDAMVALGVGKNMVRSIRFWSQAASMIEAGAKGGGHSCTELGNALLSEHGRDPFLEDIRTLWLIHWNISTNVESPLLAWDYLLNRWQEPELVPSAALKVLQKEAEKHEGRFSVVTLEQHLEAFLHTYVPTRGRKGEVQEDNLDCPLVELELIVKIGERGNEHSSGKREPIYGFRRDEKPDISPELFTYCLHDFWRRRHRNEDTLPFREVAHGHGSPGQIFKLPEEDIRMRVDALRGSITYIESANQQHLHKHNDRNNIELLNEIYLAGGANV